MAKLSGNITSEVNKLNIGSLGDPGDHPRGRSEGGGSERDGRDGASQEWFVDPALDQVTRSISEHVLQLVCLGHQETDVLKEENVRTCLENC